MRVLTTGASGMIGSALASALAGQGHEVVRLSRSRREGFAEWEPYRDYIEPSALSGTDAVVHLAGSNLAAGRWTAARKREILESRVVPTRFLVDACGRLAKPPSVFVSASGAGFYGDTDEREVDEDSSRGAGFLADVCEQWEAEAMRAFGMGMRVAVLRSGIVLSPKGGALAKLLPPFRAGLGGPIGDGRKWMSWISIDDMTSAVGHVLSHDSLRGPVNMVSPNPARNREFATTLGRVLHRPVAVPVPPMALKVMYGEMARETILSNMRVRPMRLIETGFEYRHSGLEEALRSVLSSGPEDSA